MVISCGRGVKGGLLLCPCMAICVVGAEVGRRVISYTDVGCFPSRLAFHADFHGSFLLRCS